MYDGNPFHHCLRTMEPLIIHIGSICYMASLIFIHRRGCSKYFYLDIYLWLLQTASKMRVCRLYVVNPFHDYQRRIELLIIYIWEIFITTTLVYIDRRGLIGLIWWYICVVMIYLDNDNVVLLLFKCLQSLYTVTNSNRIAHHIYLINTWYL